MEQMSRGYLGLSSSGQEISRNFWILPPLTRKMIIVLIVVLYYEPRCENLNGVVVYTWFRFSRGAHPKSVFSWKLGQSPTLRVVF